MKLLRLAWQRVRSLAGTGRRHGSAAPDRPVWTPPDAGRLEWAQQMIRDGAHPFLALQTWWRAHEPPPVEAQGQLGVIERLEAHYEIILPEDFRRYLLEYAPQTDMDDAHVMAWWGLDRIKTLSEEYKPTGDLTPSTGGDPGIAAEQDKYIVFADYMIWCWAWAVCCSDGPNRGKVAVITGKDALVADSLTDFIRDYIADPHEVAHRGI